LGKKEILQTCKKSCQIKGVFGILSALAGLNHNFLLFSLQNMLGSVGSVKKYGIFVQFLKYAKELRRTKDVLI